MENLVHRLEYENAELQSNYSHAKGQVTKLECQVESFGRQKNEILAQLENEKEKYAKLKSDMTNLQLKVSETEKALEQKTKECAKKNKLIEELKAKIADLQKVNLGLSKQLMKSILKKTFYSFECNVYHILN